MRNNLLTRYLLRRNLGAAVLGMAVSTLNTVIDAFLMGNLLGPDALSAINLSMPLSYMLVTVQCILASGASLRVSKKLGERLNREADGIYTVSIVSVFAAGLILTLLADRITKPVVGLLCTQTVLTDLCVDYCRAMILCSVPIMLQIALSSFVQRAGNPKLVLKANIASLVVNIGMDVVYVRVLGLGISGAALATGTSAAASGAVMLAFLLKEKPLHFRMPGKDWMKILLTNMGTGAAGAVQTVSTSILTFVLNFFIQKTEGADGVFVLSVGMNFLTFSLFFAMGVQNVYSSMGSMIRGQGDDTGLQMLFRSVIRIAMPVTITLVLIQLAIPGPLAQAFGAQTEEQLRIAGYGLRVISLYSLPLAWMLIMISDYQVLGHFSLASFVAVSMLATMPLSLWLIEAALPAPYIWWAMPLSAGITVVLTVAASEAFRRKHRGSLRFITLMPKDDHKTPVFEGTVDFRKGDRERLREFTDGMVPFFESLRIDRKQSFRIRLCVEEALDYIISRAERKDDIADVRIAATEGEISALIRDNLPPYDPLGGEDFETNRKILRAFCPDMEYKNAFLQNVIIMNWKLGK